MTRPVANVKTILDKTPLGVLPGPFGHRWLASRHQAVQLWPMFPRNPIKQLWLRRLPAHIWWPETCRVPGHISHMLSVACLQSSCRRPTRIPMRRPIGFRMIAGRHRFQISPAVTPTLWRGPRRLDIAATDSKFFTRTLRRCPRARYRHAMARIACETKPSPTLQPPAP